MKKIFSALLPLFFAVSGHAQTYTFTTDTATYIPLQADTVISDSGWVGNYYLVSLPFPMKVSTLTLNQVYVGADGCLARRVNSGGYIYFVPVLHAVGNCALRQKAGDISQISYRTDGISPNRIMKFQFRNAGFVGDETHSDKIDFQFWLYESGKKYEIVYGPQSLQQIRAFNGAYGPVPCIGTQYLRGNPASPQIGSPDYGLSAMPGEKRVYRFTRP